MERFNNLSVVNDVYEDKIIGKYAKYLFFKFPSEIKTKRISDISWYAQAALNFFYEQSKENRTAIYDIDKMRKNAKIIHISHKNQSKFCIIVSGGALSCIDTFHEGLPIAERMFLEGYDVFLLNYEVGAKARKTGPSKDINSAIKFIIEKSRDLNINKNDFGLIGGSAGAYIAAQYCSNNLGYIKHNNPKPAFLCLLYPVVDFALKDEVTRQNSIGKNPSDKLIKKYSPVYHIDKAFPPTFIAHSKDDNAVPFQNSVNLAKVLDKANIKNCLVLYETGNHGWSSGYKLEPGNWFDTFLKFLKSL